MKKKVKILLLLFSVFSLTACFNEGKEKNREVDNKVEKEGFKITWYANLLQENDLGEFAVTDKIVCKDDITDMRASIIFTREDEENVEIPIICAVLVDGTPVKFRIDNNSQDIIQHTKVVNGEENLININFKSVGEKNIEKEIIFIAIPYYKEKTEKLSDNIIMYCKKTLVNEVMFEDIEEVKYDENYETAETTKEICGKELYEISEYNGTLKDYILYENNIIKYIGDYTNKEGRTYIFVDSKFYIDEIKCLKWKASDKRFIYKEIKPEALAEGKHIVFAVTIIEDEVVVARKSFNEEIEIE